MPDLTAVHFALFAIVVGLGAVLGWMLRGDRSAREKIAINAGWQEQFEVREQEAKRLVTQNKNLMEQVRHLQAAEKDASQRSRSITESLKEAVERQDDLQRQLQDARDDLAALLEQRNRLQRELQARHSHNDDKASALRDKDMKIFRLSRELTSWQNRVPPLVEKYRQRELELKELQFELDQARERIGEVDALQAELEQSRERLAELEGRYSPDETHIEPIDPGRLTDGRDASNDQYDDSAELDLSSLQDQVMQTPEAPADDRNTGFAFTDDDDDEDPAHVSGSSFFFPPPVADHAVAEDQPLADPDNPQHGTGAENGIEITGTAAEEDATPDEGGDDDFFSASEVHTDAATGQDAPQLQSESDGLQADSTTAAWLDGLQGAETPIATIAETRFVDGHSPTQENRDDLQQIRGVGPSIEQLLNELGIYRYEQIAGISEYDIDRVAEKLKGFRTKVYREDWIGQARALHYQKRTLSPI